MAEQKSSKLKIFSLILLFLLLGAIGLVAFAIIISPEGLPLRSEVMKMKKERMLAVTSELKTECELLSTPEKPYYYAEGKLLRSGINTLPIDCISPDNKGMGPCGSSPAVVYMKFLLNDDQELETGMGGEYSELKVLADSLTKDQNYALCYTYYISNNRQQFAIDDVTLLKKLD